MATTPVEFYAPSGLTLTLELYPYGSDTIANGAGDSATEATNCKGLYSADVTEAISGWHNASIIDGSSNVIAAYDVWLDDDTSIKRCHDAPARAHDGNAQVGVNWADIDNPTTAVDLSGTDIQLVDTCTTNTDMRGTDSAALASNYTAARAGYLDNINGHTAQTGDSFARLGAPAGASVSADIATVDSNVDTLLTRITSTLFSGITSLAEWLGLIAGKQVGDATARTELRATGAGSGTFDETTDSQEALRDHVGDGSNLTEAGGTGDHLTAVPWNSAWDAEVQSECADALAAYNAVATTDLPTNFADLSITLTTGRVDVASIEGSDATDQIRDSILSDSTTFAGANIDAAISSRSDFDESTDPVEILASGGSAGKNAEEIVDDLCDEVITGAAHNVNNSLAKFIREAAEGIGLTGTAQGATSSTIQLASGEFPATAGDDYFKSERIQVIEGTGAGQARFITGGTASTDTVNIVPDWDITPSTDSVYSISGAESEVRSISGDVTAADNLESDYDGTGYNKSASTIGTTTTNTDMRGTDSAFLAASAPTNFSSMVIDGNGRIDVSKWLGTAVTVSSTTSLPEVDAKSISDSATAANNVESNIGNLDAAISGLNDLSAAEVNTEVDTALSDIHLDHLVATSGAVDNADVSATSTVFKTDLLDQDNTWDDQLLVITSGALAGQAKPILSYDQTNGQVTLAEALTDAPSDNVTFIIMASHVHPVSQIADGVLDEALSGHSTAGTLGKAVTDIEVDTNSLNDTKVPQTLNLTASGNIGIDWANVENPTTAVDLSGTDIQLCDTVTTNTDMRGTDSALLAASAPANFSSLSINGSGRVDIGSWLGTAVTVSATTALPEVDAKSISDNAAAADNVQANIGNLDAAISSLNDLSTADIDARLAAIGLDHLVSASVSGTDVQDNSIFAKLVSKSATADWDDFVNTDDSLQAIRDRGDSAWPTATSVTVSDKTGFSLSSAGITSIWTQALTEAYRSTGSTGTAAQLLYEILQNLTEFSILSTTKTVKKLNGSSTAKTYTLDDDASPTSITEAT